MRSYVSRLTFHVSRFTFHSFANRPTLKKITNNISWLFLDKVLRMGVGLFVGAWIARYLGPDQFGLWNYAIAFTALFGAFSTLGLDGIVVRELVKYPEKTNELLGTTFVLRLSGAFIAFSLSIITAMLIGNRDFLTLSLISLSAGGFIFQSFLTIDYFYQAHIMSRYTVWAQNIAFLIMSAVKIGLIFAQAPLLAFAIAGLIEIILGSAFLVGFYLYKSHPLSLSPSLSNFPSLSLPLVNHWHFSLPTAKSLLKDSWPLILSGIAIMIYMRIDQVMLKNMLGDKAVGLYSAAVKLSEIWYFIPVLISQSVFPSIINAKKVSEELYYARLQKLYDLMVWLAILIALPMTFFSNWIIKLLYGNQYIQAAGVLKIYIWAGVFVFLGVVSGTWFLSENLQKYSFYRTLSGAIINVLLNFSFIPSYGISGAAFATVISQFTASYLFNVTNRKLRYMFLLQTNSILLPFRNLWLKHEK